jgi:hypothetical protein
MLKRAFRDKWLERLTDGSFSKARGVLIDPRNEKKRCCLGVALSVGVELGLLTEEQTRPVGDGAKYLTHTQATLFGIIHADQRRFAVANDSYAVPEGQYYPDEVLRLIREQPVID